MHVKSSREYVYRCPAVEAAAVASVVLSAALEVCREQGGDYLPAAMALQFTLQAHLMYLNTGAAHCLMACLSAMTLNYARAIPYCLCIKV